MIGLPVMLSVTGKTFTRGIGLQDHSSEKRELLLILRRRDGRKLEQTIDSTAHFHAGVHARFQIFR